jgi:hypothetical protein
VFGGELQAFREVEGEAGADTFARAGKDVSGGLSEVAGSAGGFGEELLDQGEIVAAGCGGAAGGRHGRKRRKGESGDLKGGRKSGRGSGSPGRSE